jgi:hypothetical protein
LPALKVEGPKSGSATGPIRRTGGTAGPSSASGKFSAELDKAIGAEGEGSAPAVEGTGGVVGVGGSLAAQAVAPDDHSPQERRRRAQRGFALLESLEEIRKGLLLGRIPKDRLAELVRTVREKRERGTDPVIARLLDEIELRASMELVNLGLPVW